LSQTASFLTGADAIPGLSMLGGRSLALGTGTIQWNSSTGIVTWTDSLSASYTVNIGADGLYQIECGSGFAYLTIVNTQLPSGTVSTQYSIQPNYQNIFDDLVYSERSSNHRNLRCLWIKNNKPFPIVNVVVSALIAPTYGEIRFGSEYTTNQVATMSQAYAEYNMVNQFGHFRLGAYGPLSAIDDREFHYAPTDGMFLQAAHTASVAVQDSNGVSTDLPLVLADENDSTGLVVGLNWGATLQILSIPANKWASFWVRREIAAGSSGSALVAENFKLQVSYQEA
jgi:hypothetical protein